MPWARSMSAASAMLTPRLFATTSIVPENTDTLGFSAQLRGEHTQHPDASAHDSRADIIILAFIGMNYTIFSPKFHTPARAADRPGQTSVESSFVHA